MKTDEANKKVHEVFSDFCVILIENETLFNRIIEDLQSSPADALGTCFNFCQFMVLKWLHSTELVEPSATIDIVWHQTILHTEAYEAFCLNNFGRYMHHTPSLSGHSYQRTLELLKETLGLDIQLTDAVTSCDRACSQAGATL
jgi:hypothetical protein